MPTSASAPTQPPSPKTPAPVRPSGIPRSEELVTYVRDCKSSGIPIEICYQCFGDPEAGDPVVLLVCGLNMQLYAWDETFCEDLVRAGFFVVRYDNRDIGHSTKVEQIGSVVGPRLLLPDKWATFFGERLPYSLESMARDGLALLDALGIEKAHVFGISMGGAIAQMIALIAPHRIMSLTSLMSSTNGQDLPDPQMSVKLWMLRQPPKGCTIDELMDFRVNSLRHLLTHALPVDGTYLKDRFLMSLERNSYGAGLVRQAAALRRTASRDDALRTMTIPSLVIHGAQDVVVPPIHGYRTAQCLPHARLLVFKSMGHYFHPAFFPAIVTAFADMAATTSAVGGSPLRGQQLYHTLVPGFKPPTAAAVDVNTFPTSAVQAATREKSTASSAEAVSPTTASATTASAIVATLEGQVDLTNEQLMASIGPYLFPVVTSIYSKTGKAASALVNTAIPISGTIPVPEAVLLDLHEPAPSRASASAEGSYRPLNSPTRERGGVGRVQGVAVVAVHSNVSPRMKPAASPPPPSATTTATSTATPPPPPPPTTSVAASITPLSQPSADPSAPPSLTPSTVTSTSPDAAQAAVTAPSPSVANTVSRWWGAVVSKASASVSRPSTSTPTTNTTTAVTDGSALPSAISSDKPTGEKNGSPRSAASAASAAAPPSPAVLAEDVLEIEDVVEPFVPGSPSTWNQARFPTAMAARKAAANEEQAADDAGHPAPVRLVGVPLATHLQRLHEKAQRRRLLEERQRQDKLATRSTSTSSKDTPPRARPAHKPVFASPLAERGAKGMVLAPGVIHVVTKRASDGVTLDTHPLPPSGGPVIRQSDEERDKDESCMALASNEEEEREEEEPVVEEDVHNRAASTYDIASTLLAPVLPTETDDMVISALPSPTEQDIECVKHGANSMT